MLIAAILVGALIYFIGVQMTQAAESSSGNLTAAQIAVLAQNAGFVGTDLSTAVAVALAESSGNPSAYNPETAAGTPEGKGSYGLWQIYLKMHPEYTAAQLLDPQENANAAYKIYQAAGGSFTPWSTYSSSNAYMNFADVAEEATGFSVSS